MKTLFTIIFSILSILGFSQKYLSTSQMDNGLIIDKLDNGVTQIRTRVFSFGATNLYFLKHSPDTSSLYIIYGNTRVFLKESPAVFKLEEKEISFPVVKYAIGQSTIAQMKIKSDSFISLLNSKRLKQVNFEVTERLTSDVKISIKESESDEIIKFLKLMSEYRFK